MAETLAVWEGSGSFGTDLWQVKMANSDVIFQSELVVNFKQDCSKSQHANQSNTLLISPRYLVDHWRG